MPIRRPPTAEPAARGAPPASVQLLLAFAVGGALAAVVLRAGEDPRPPRADEPIAVDGAAPHAAGVARDGLDAPDAASPRGLPPGDVTELPPRDSLPARRRALARTLREMVPSGRAPEPAVDPETTAAVARAVRAALVEHLSQRGEER
ncbi:MAG: hypothetical protein AB1689_20515 [Thermodesulfobacteriota bacterium]